MHDSACKEKKQNKGKMATKRNKGFLDSTRHFLNSDFRACCRGTSDHG